MYYKTNVCQTHNLKRLTIKIIILNISLTHAEYSFPKKPYFGEGGHNVIIYYLLTRD